MTTEARSRPEVQLGICPRDGGDMFRQSAEVGNVWICGRCGLLTHGDPTSRSAIWEALAEV